MRPAIRRPSIVDLYASPELGVLAVLESAVDVALLALVAAYPEDEPDAENVPLERRAARNLVSAAGDLATALHRYRLALVRARERDCDDLLPF
jgi:hypothetical protein